MSEKHELLENSENGNHHPHGTFISKEEAHKHAKSLGLASHEYKVNSYKEHEAPHWAKGEKSNPDKHCC